MSVNRWTRYGRSVSSCLLLAIGLGEHTQDNQSFTKVYTVGSIDVVTATCLTPSSLVQVVESMLHRQSQATAVTGHRHSFETFLSLAPTGLSTNHAMAHTMGGSSFVTSHG
ncbi:hypothetical protein BDZ85DRAFT_130748 [Elsinoe ampelina]|uniref:Secreted protein n=1 Tax=Elsinoe ampelina TaxID=302913 RepID=A0A6A6GA55_9PEZI|nr:hypothetical protein BDZ85DRAFT_130748 [Elsinoe ampelina]